MKISILADQLGSGAGGGRFTNGYLRALLSDNEALEKIGELDILVTENQPTAQLYPLPPQVRVIYRRFPSRLRSTYLAKCLIRTIPATDVAHGLCFYVFPEQGRQTIATMLDASFLDDNYHTGIHNRRMKKLVDKQLDRCDAIVCISHSISIQFQARWPRIAEKVRTIYPGVDALSVPVVCTRDDSRQPIYILAVGTIEPRKNYSVILDAYEQLRLELGKNAPQLVIVGKEGWMSDFVRNRIMLLEKCNILRWIKNATDDELAVLYQKAYMFTYLSLYEGFGYPPFEAAYANLPMVVSNVSSIGEIWSGYARCVAPTDVRAIVSGWKWALGLRDNEREAVIERQNIRAAEFTWKRCVSEYLKLYADLNHIM